MMPRFTNWHKSTRSGSQSDCVEVGVCGDQSLVGVRDSKAPTAAVLAFPYAQWVVFVDAVKRGAVRGR